MLALGYLQAHVVYAGPDNHFSGFRPDRITALGAHPGLAPDAPAALPA